MAKPTDESRYDPPYEAGEGGLDAHNEDKGSEHDFRETQVLREPDLPDVFEKGDDPTDGVSRGTESDQGDDDLTIIKPENLKDR